jgi:HECT-domain (ubiquitin-transferase)
VAHTCFFSLELPAYSSLEVMTKKLLYAIYNCQVTLPHLVSSLVSRKPQRLRRRSNCRP